MIAAVLGLGLLAAGCSGSPRQAAAPLPPVVSSPVPAPAPSLPSPDPATAGPTTPDPATTGGGSPGTTAASPAAPLVVRTATYFRSPSGNISCLIAAGQVRCDVAAMSFTPPPKPADCPLEWGHTVEIGAGPAEFGCVGDTVADEPGPATLPYGAGITNGRYTCRSEPNGISCRGASGAFRLARESFEIG